MNDCMEKMNNCSSRELEVVKNPYLQAIKAISDLIASATKSEMDIITISNYIQF